MYKTVSVILLLIGFWGCGENYSNGPDGQRHPENEGWLRVDVSGTSVCAVTTQNRILCWGDVYRLNGGVLEGRFQDVSLANNYVCGLGLDGRVACQGDQVVEPIDVEFMQISSGREYSCGVTVEGSVECWGFASYGQMDPPDERFKRGVSLTLITLPDSPSQRTA